MSSPRQTKAVKILLSILFSLLLSFCVNTTAVSAEELSPLEQGITYYKQENYDEALSILQKARELEPDSSLAAYYLGITYKQLQDYKNAKSHLIDAVSLTPKIKEALLELVDVLYQLGELNNAKRYIGLAEREDVKPAQIAFLKGLVLLKEGDNLDAVEAFEKAKELDSSLQQSADYQIGLAYLKEKKFEEAKEVFREVIVLEPNTDLAAFANRYIDAIEKKKEAERPFRFTVGLAGQYDDNVLLKPSDATVAEDITNEDDFREVLTFKGEYRKRLTEKFGLNSQYSLYYAHQNNIGLYDVLSHSLSLTPTYYFTKGTVGLPVGYNYTRVGEKEYLSTISAMPLCNLIFGKTQMGQLSFKYQRKDFLRAPLNADENRDSNDFGGGLGWFVFFAENRGFFSLRYEINKDDTKGNNWRYIGNRINATLLYPFFEKFKISVSGDAFLQDFSETHTVFNVEREDKVYTASTMLAYNFWKNAELQFRYTYVKDDSNIIIYDYDRNVYSIGVEYKF
ncbi:MAG: hypothetical protein AMJ78_01930 [Omnitrophica WOR_2 bacterium SM23_29]|nr:MAG: hypothetical protein AMJ78_01930 [Omnitrophica WOR_2 bacterium SM23_29]